MVDKIEKRTEECRIQHKIISEQIADTLKSKYSSTNKSINQNDLTIVQGLLKQLNILMDTMGDIAVINGSICDRLGNLDESIQKISPSSQFYNRSYAQATRVTSEDDKIVMQNQNVTDKTIIFKSKLNVSPAEVLGEVNNGIKKMRNDRSKVKINKIIKSKSGVILKVDSGENLKTLIEEFKKIDEANQKALIYAPKQLDSTIVLKSITKSTDIKELPSILCNMNPELEGREKKIKVLFAMRSNTDVQDVVLRFSPSRQDSERQGTSKQIDHCLYRKMEQGREENPKEPMESDPDSESGGSTTFPKKENTLGRTEEIAPGQEDVTPPPPVSDVLGSLARTIYQLSSATGLSRDVELPRYDGSYEAQSFFDNYDAQADLAQLHYTDRLRRLPNLLQGKALHYFRSLKLDKLYYVDARQALKDLFPETTNASFAQFLAIKLTDRSSLEEYYQKKTVCGLQLNLPHKILLESLTDGLPVADQRIVAAVQPNTLQAWYSVVSRVRGTHSASQVCQQTTRTTPNPSFAPSPRYSAPRPWSARPNYSANPPPSSCRYCGAMHWHAQCPKRPAQSRPRPVYRATTYPQHDRTVLSSPAPFQVNNTRAHVTRSPDPLYTTSPAQAVNPSCPIGTSTTAPKQACSDAQDSTTLLLYQDNVPLPTTLYKFTSCKQHVSHGQVNTTVPFTKSSPPGTGCSHVVNSNTLIWPQCNVPDPIFNASMSSSCISLDTSNLGHCPYNLHKVLHQFTPVFAANKYDVPKLKIPPVKINTTSDKVIALRPYRVPLNDQLEIQTQIEHMLEHGIITTSVSPYASPITLVTKRDKSKRFCVDYRRINEIIAPDVHPLPLIENILDKLSRAKYFSSADISSAYWQVEIDPSSRHLLAFVTLDGQYEFCRLPFGMRNSPQIFERAINQIFQKYKLNFIAHYFDDFIIFSDTLEEHIQHVEKFLEICQQENIKLNYKKCEFLKTSIEFLGYTVKNGTYTPQTRNLDIINAIKPPFNQKTLQSFLGAVNVYNKFIPNYARLRTPLNNLLKKDTKWQWDDKCQQAFTALKESLTRRLFRWSLRLSTYDYEIQYLKGTQQHEADLLSRNPFCGFISARTIKKHQPKITDTSVAVDVNGLHTIRRKGVNRIIIPEALQHSLMNQVHSEYNHPGISQMARLISTQYYWKGMAKSIQKFVNSCHTCQIIKRPKGKPYGTLGQIPPPQQPFDLISIDTIAGFSKYGHSKTYLHVIVDHLTRYAWAFPSKSTSTLTYIQTLKKVLQQGSPKRLLSDRAPAFTSEKFRKFLLSRGIQPLLTTSNNPQANGLIERLNATITGKLRLLYLENPKTSWTKLIKQVVQIYNQSPHTVTGFPPIFLMFNSIPPELKTHYNPFPDVQKARQLASSRTQLKHERDKQRYDKGHQAPHFEIGDLALVKNYKHPDTGKLAPYFTGPFTIIEIISPNVVRINRPNRLLNKEDDTVHVNKLKYYTEDILFLAPQPLIPTPRLLPYQDNVPLPTTLYKFTSCKQHVSHGQVNTTLRFTKPSPPGTGCSHVVNSNALIWPHCNVPDPILNAFMSSSCIALDTSNLDHCPYNLHNVLHQFAPVFAANKYDVPRLKIPLVKSNTTSDKVIALRPHKVPLNDQPEIQTQIEKLLEHGIITTSVSPYASPITLVTKRDKSKRFCVDYRRINGIIAQDVHSLPLIENRFDKLSRAKYSSSADISSAYWQNIWFLDSGATEHMTSNRLKMTNTKSISTSVEMANNEKIRVSEMGDVTIKLGHEYGGETLLLENVLYVPELDGNILSVGRIEERGNKVLFQNGKASVFESDGELILKSNRRGRIYTVEELKMAKVKSPSADIWHRRLGHIYKRDLQNVSDTAECEVCLEGEFNKFLNENGIKRQLTVPRTPRENGTAERMNQTLLNTARCILLESGIPKSFWADAVNTACYLRNKCSSKAIGNKIPEEMWTERPVKIEHIRVFGCQTWAFDLFQFDSRSRECVLIDYESIIEEETKLVERNQKDELKKEDEEGQNGAAIPRGYSGTDEETISVEKYLNNMERREDGEQAYEDEALRREDEEGQNETIIPRRSSRIAARQKDAPEYFQKRMSAILRGINGVICHMDDILIYAKRKGEHDETLHEVLRRLKNSGIILNNEKCQFGVSNTTFLVHYIDEHGIKADEKKVKAFAEMKPPTDLHGVQRFMGMDNFLGRFVPNLAEITKPLNDLRKKDASFIWCSPQKKAFEKVKYVLASDRVQASFDISKKTMVSADATSYGLGAVPKQEHEANEWRPVAFASRTLTKTEQGYAQIKKEALAITWACERFKDFVVGKTFLIETDNKPLVPIFTTKDLNDLTPRLQ
ncbi:hypothetical protein LAZ67_2003420 [Cordylochernes scorpioides]|uniref:RNA-directed DNA polymerase n=1 Tax=Cordylochernes scorpioides TaxID=51811 RepID=A0ABY6K2X9_9ARAC|nr:hypothetical protein LAZ67_2003420 [Cordylochernes scorpioides]